MTQSDLDRLRVRAYGPGQSPLTASEAVLLETLEALEQADSSRPDPEGALSVGPAGHQTRPRAGLVVAAALIVATAVTGFAVGAGWANVRGVFTPRVDGVLIEGRYRLLGDAECSVSLGPQGAALKAAECRWTDGTTVTFHAEETDR